MKRVRVLVVDDSLTVRRLLVETFDADPALEVVGEAADGRAAIEQCERLRPDVVTLDMMLPFLTGAEATEHIMAYNPTPILIVSSSLNRGEVMSTYQALTAGAVDVIEKPGEQTDLETWKKRLIAAVKMTARIKVITHPRGRLRRPSEQVEKLLPEAAGATGTGGCYGAEIGKQCEYLVIGASTGGPQALSVILGALPADYPLPVLLVIHISSAFAGSFAEWLGQQCRLPVRMAVDNEPAPRFRTPGVILAPPDRHLVVRGGRLRLTDDPEVHSCRPSVDVLFHSAALEWGACAAGVLLTGMGRDGAGGLLAVRKAGGVTIAQDEASSVVFGMPGEAVRLGAAARVVPLHQIAAALIALARPSQDFDTHAAANPGR